MFENLQEKLQRAFKSLRGQAVLSEENIQEALREIRLALLEADVNFKVVKQLHRPHPGEGRRTAGADRALSRRAGHQDRPRRTGRDPRQRYGQAEVRLAASDGRADGRPAGFRQDHHLGQAGELAEEWRTPSALVSVDVYRPAAREQLKVVAQAIKAQHLRRPGREANTATVERLVERSTKEAIISGCDVLIVDTAGRLHIDDQLMDEMQSLKKLLNPQEILFVADAMTGQDAVNSADEFHKKLTLTGVVLTKMDGDARGGAALSIRQVTGQPIKFIGVGEKYDALEPFHPDRIVSRILGMGDILSLIEKAESQIDKKKAEEMANRALTGDGFSLEDFRDQLRQVKKMGSLQSLMGMLPSIGPFAGLQKHADKVDEKQLNRVEAIINSMTSHERIITK